MDIRWDIIEQLLLCRTRSTSRIHNITWATGEHPDAEITEADTPSIVPRCIKPREVQRGRTKSKAEVFTPTWVVNQMINMGEAERYGSDSLFNVASADGRTWTPTERVILPEGVSWEDYVASQVLEITCGEGAFLTTRYDPATGEAIPIKQRVGLLDRKLRLVSENCDTPSAWIKWAYRALETTYGYEYQGDSLYLARRNVLETFCEAYEDKWGQVPSIGRLEYIVGIITWNIWQMDGLTDCVPMTDIPARILDREAHRVIEFRSLKGGDAGCTRKRQSKTKSA